MQLPAPGLAGQWTVAGKDDREPSGHHTREGIGLKHGEPDGRRTASQAAMNQEQI